METKIDKLTTTNKIILDKLSIFNIDAIVIYEDILRIYVDFKKPRLKRIIKKTLNKIITDEILECNVQCLVYMSKPPLHIDYKTVEYSMLIDNING